MRRRSSPGTTPTRATVLVYTRRLFAMPCASSPSTSTASARPSARASRAGSRAVAAWDVVCLQELKAHRRRRAPVPARAAQVHALFPSRRSARATRASASTPARRPRSRPASAAREFDAEGRYLRGRFRRAVGHQPVPAVGVERARTGRRPSSASWSDSCRICSGCAQAGREIILCGDWNIAHQNDRPHELAQQPEELRLPARGARLAHARLRRAGLRRRLPQGRSASRAVHVVVQSRAGVGEERRLAHRLPDRHARHRATGARRVDLQEPPLLRSRAAHRSTTTTLLH